MVKKILMLVGDYVEDYEVMVFFQVLQMVGYMVYVVCLDKCVGDFVVIVIYDFEGVQMYFEKFGYCFIVNVILVEVDLVVYDVFVVFGGCVFEYLWLNVCVLDIVWYFVQVDKFIVVICYGVQLLLVVGVLEGKVCLVYLVCGLEVMVVGGIFKDIFVDQVYIDGKLVMVFVWLVYLVWLVQFFEVLGMWVLY